MRERTGRPPDVGSIRQQAGEEDRLHREAIAEVRAASKGKSRGEIHVMLINALEARNLSPLPDRLVDVEIDGIMAVGLLARVRVAIDAFRVTRGLSRGRRQVLELLQGKSIGPRPGVDVWNMTPDYSRAPAEVELDPDSLSFIALNVRNDEVPPNSASFSEQPGDLRKVSVWLDLVAPNDSTSPIIIGVDGRGIGKFADVDNREFRQILERIFENGAMVMAEGVAVMVAGVVSRVYVWFPKRDTAMGIRLVR